MSEKRYAVPEGMLKAAENAALSGMPMPRGGSLLPKILEAALRVLDGELETLSSSYNVQFGSHSEAAVNRFSDRRKGKMQAIEDVRRMFLAPEPEVPEAVKDLGCTPEQLATLDGVNKEIAIRANNAIAEAYRRGQKGAKL